MVITKFFLSSFFAVALFAGNANAKEKISLNTKNFEKGINEQEIQILDVRTMSEYQTGHLKNALLADWTDQAQFKERVSYLDKTKPIYTYCLSGFRSKQAVQWLQENDFKRVYTLEGGIMAWKKADLPLEGLREVQQITLEQYLSGIPADKTVLPVLSMIGKYEGIVL